jgi:uncharacterized membrane protein YwzB
MITLDKLVYASEITAMIIIISIVAIILGFKLSELFTKDKR